LDSHNWHYNPSLSENEDEGDIAVAINSNASHHSGSGGSCALYFVILRNRKVLATKFQDFSIKSVTDFYDTHLISGPSCKNGPIAFNKLAVSAVNGAREIQPALANINFDFSLWKMAPPKEFKGAGAALTTFRRNEAENGCAHRTTRK
jgi:hypothetical protein